jgi:hypothetical protein
MPDRIWADGCHFQSRYFPWKGVAVTDNETILHVADLLRDAVRFRHPADGKHVECDFTFPAEWCDLVEKVLRASAQRSKCPYCPAPPSQFTSLENWPGFVRCGNCECEFLLVPKADAIPVAPPGTAPVTEGAQQAGCLYVDIDDVVYHLDDIEVDADGKCSWTNVANALTHIKLCAKAGAIPEGAQVAPLPVAWRIMCTNNGATGYLYTEALPFDPGPGVKVRRDPEPLYASPIPEGMRKRPRRRDYCQDRRAFSELAILSRSYRDLIDCIDCTLHQLREAQS